MEVAGKTSPSREITIILLLILTIFCASYGMRQINASQHSLYDFGSFYYSSLALQDGISPYIDYSTTRFKELLPFEILGPNMNPPGFLLLFKPLTLLPPTSALTLWRILSFVFFFLSLLIVTKKTERTHGPALFLLLLAGTPFWLTLQLGQVYSLLAFICALLIQALARSGTLSGFFYALLIFLKPNYLLLIPALFLLRKTIELRSTLFFLGTFTLLTMLQFGPAMYIEWIQILPESPSRPIGIQASLVVLFHYYVTKSHFAYILFVLIFSGWYLYWLQRQKPALYQATYSCLLLTLLVNPVGWIGYILLAAPFILIRKPSLITYFSLGALCLPAGIVFNISRFNDHAPTMMHLIYPLSVLLLFIESIREDGFSEHEAA